MSTESSMAGWTGSARIVMLDLAGIDVVQGLWNKRQAEITSAR